jgi:hypothetical protein
MLASAWLGDPSQAPSPGAAASAGVRLWPLHTCPGGRGDK